MLVQGLDAGVVFAHVHVVRVQEALERCHCHWLGIFDLVCSVSNL
jgi:hypothetical protein